MSGVPLGNVAGNYPNGDEVQTVIPWQPPKLWADVSSSQLNAALTGMDSGMENGQRYSSASAAKARHAWPVLKRHCPHKARPTAAR